MEDVVTLAAKESGMTPEDFSELIFGGLDGWCAALQVSDSKAKRVGVTAAPDHGPESSGIQPTVACVRTGTAELAPIEMKVTRCRIVGMLNTGNELWQRADGIFSEIQRSTAIKCLIQNDKSIMANLRTFQIADLEGFFVRQDNGSYLDV
jgi:hypothetical protein